MSDDTFRPFDLDPSIYEVDEIADTALQPLVMPKSLTIDEVNTVKKRPRGKN